MSCAASCQRQSNYKGKNGTRSRELNEKSLFTRVLRDGARDMSNRGILLPEQPLALRRVQSNPIWVQNDLTLQVTEKQPI